MLNRSLDALVQLKARMREPLRARLESSAKRHVRSLNSELVDRLERSFQSEDFLGGPEIASLAQLMSAAFLRGGQGRAYRMGNPKWKVGRWINNSDCFQAATEAVKDALDAIKPPLASDAGLANQEVRNLKAGSLEPGGRDRIRRRVSKLRKERLPPH
jgi:hypothetical protein